MKIDLLESKENAAERMYDEMEQADGRLKCHCGNLFDPLLEGGTVSPDPYAVAVCDECLSEAMEYFKKQKEESNG